MNSFPLGMAIAGAFLLVVFVAIFLIVVQRRQMRRALGLPAHSKLGPADKQALLAFRNTDMGLRETFPDAPEQRRRAAARRILRSNGLLSHQSSKGRGS